MIGGVSADYILTYHRPMSIEKGGELIVALHTSRWSQSLSSVIRSVVHSGQRLRIDRGDYLGSRGSIGDVNIVLI